jgi:methionyl-tRNA synthetase
MATIDDFKNIEMKVGKILSAVPVEGSEKLLKLSVDFGEEGGPRQILSGIAKYYAPETLVGKLCPFVTNLPPRAMMGLDSNGMILAVKTVDGGAVLLHPEKDVEPGSGLS